MRQEAATTEPVETLIVRLCRRDAADRVTPRDTARLADPASARAFLESSARHGVRGLVLTRLQGMHSAFT